jgi:hypothetical protein
MNRTLTNAEQGAARLRFLALLQACPDGMTLQELVSAYDETRAALPPISHPVARSILIRMSDVVFATHRETWTAAQPLGSEIWLARQTPATVPIDTGAFPPRDHPVYFARPIHPDDLDGGRVVYRQDPGASCYQVIAPCVTADEARYIVVALNDAAEARLEREHRTADREVRGTRGDSGRS